MGGGLLLTGCNKDEVSGDFQFGGVSKSVTSAVVYLYDRSSEETNYEVYLMLDGTEWDSEYGSAVYFDLYFEGAVDELPAGTYVLGDDILDYAATAAIQEQKKRMRILFPGH